MLLAFEGMSRPVSLIDSDDLVEAFAAVLRGWRFPEVSSSAAPPPIITIRRTATGYALESAWRPAPAHYRDKVDAVCAFIVDLVKGYIADDPSLLCLHCAAAEFAGRLVVFPSRYRAGKSTISAYLAAAGLRVYADDVLPIKEPGNRGVAPGVAPRLRLPLPQAASGAFRDYVDGRRGLANKRYLYLDLGADELAGLGTKAPIGAFVHLRRDPRREPGLEAMAKSEMLRRVILRNFAGEVGAVDIVNRLHALVAEAQCFRLRYADGDEAVALLAETFGRWPERRRVSRKGLAATRTARVQGKAGGSPAPSFTRNPKVVETVMDRDVFLVEPGSQGIYELNAIGTALWRLLAEPIGVEDAVGVLHDGFPHVPRAEIERDVGALMADLAARGLVIESR